MSSSKPLCPAEDCGNESTEKSVSYSSSPWNEALVGPTARKNKSARSTRGKNTKSKPNQADGRIFPGSSGSYGALKFEDLPKTPSQMWTSDFRKALQAKPIDNSKIIARVTFGGDIVPGWANTRGEGNIAWGGQGIIVTASKKVQYLLEHENMTWERWTGFAPKGAVVAGRTGYGENLYVARYEINKEKIPGRLQLSYDCLLLSANEREYVVKDDFEVLVSKTKLQVDEE